MKNAVYAGVIAVCILGAVLVFLHRGSGSDKTPDQQILVKCMKCNQSYEMSQKQFYKEMEEKARASKSPMMRTMPLTCQKCGQDGIRKAFKCGNCGEVFFANSVPNDFDDRCPKCKHSATEDNRNANKARQGQ
jgi:DNA-directed RNA polymerase subunit RPC12/RpoP